MGVCIRADNDVQVVSGLTCSSMLALALLANTSRSWLTL